MQARSFSFRRAIAVLLCAALGVPAAYARQWHFDVAADGIRLGTYSIIVQESGAIVPVGLGAQTEYWGVFLADRLPLSASLTAELGLRYNRARVELKDRIGTALNGQHQFERLNPGIELDWALDPDLTLRAGYAETNRAPTPAELSCADEEAPCSLASFFVADPPLKQVVARNYELGAQGDAELSGWRLHWLASAYRTSINGDIQYSASAIRGRAYFRNIGDTRRQGVELSLKARRGGLQVAASYAYTDATYRSRLAISSPAHPQADEDGAIDVEPGDHLPGIPRHNVALSLDYAGRLSGGRSFTLGGDVVAHEPISDGRRSQPRKSRARLRAGQPARQSRAGAWPVPVR